MHFRLCYDCLTSNLQPYFRQIVSLYTLFLCAAKDEKNKAIFIYWWTLRTNKNNYNCIVLWTLRTKPFFNMSKKLDIAPFMGIEPTMSNKLDI